MRIRAAFGRRAHGRPTPVACPVHAEEWKEPVAARWQAFNSGHCSRAYLRQDGPSLQKDNQQQPASQTRLSSNACAPSTLCTCATSTVHVRRSSLAHGFVSCGRRRARAERSQQMPIRGMPRRRHIWRHPAAHTSTAPGCPQSQQGREPA